MSPHLLEQVPPFLSRECLDELLFGRRQHTLETDHEEIADQVGMDILRPAAHVLLLELADSCANGGFDFSL
jgi:hypothetical protein